MPLETDDQHLLLAAIAGDQDASARLLFQHSDTLVRRLSARLQLNPYADFSVEDVLQEVFLDVFRGIGSFDITAGGSFESWLFKVADNRLASMLRERGAKKRGGTYRQTHAGRDPLRSSVQNIVASVVDASAKTASECAAQEEMIQALRQNLAALPVEQRQALQHHYLDEHNVDSTAAEMQKTDGAVRGLLHRAKKSMRSALGHSSRWFLRKQ